jgi:hypothetical protein
MAHSRYAKLYTARPSASTYSGSRRTLSTPPSTLGLAFLGLAHSRLADFAASACDSSRRMLRWVGHTLAHGRDRIDNPATGACAPNHACAVLWRAMHELGGARTVSAWYRCRVPSPDWFDHHNKRASRDGRAARLWHWYPPPRSFGEQRGLAVGREPARQCHAVADLDGFTVFTRQLCWASHERASALRPGPRTAAC